MAKKRPPALQRENFGNLTATGTGDADGDRMSNLAEYQAGTDPNNAADNLRTTSYTRSGNVGSFPDILLQVVKFRLGDSGSENQRQAPPAPQIPLTL